ncbi:hypothetical protein GM51_8860 [freshwater metagenome]|uniref:DUF4190 domain-containing protein n=1 Tax=freshwater metagenome TaxID=449393 RepID=A0A094Q490_9ZZZZ
MSAIAVWSLILGTLAFAFAVTPLFGVSFLFAIPGLILGIVALARREKPFSVALLGLIISAVGWLISIIVAVAVAASTVQSLQSIKNLPPKPATSVSASKPAASVPAIAPIVWSGDGELVTEKQTLNGDFKVTLTTSADCYYGPDLNGAGFPNVPSLMAPGTVESNLYDLSGEYYLQMFTGPSPQCPWTLTLTPN